MARVEMGNHVRGRWCSYKRTTLAICSINIVIVLYILRSIYSSLYLYSSSYSPHSVKFKPHQIERIEESIRIRKAADPVELIKVVKDINGELIGHRSKIKIPRRAKVLLMDEILQRLKRLDDNANTTQQREAVENWRKEKLEELKHLAHDRKNRTMNISAKEAAYLVKAMETKWPMFMEEVGLWIPPDFVNVESDEEPGHNEEFEEVPLLGRPIPPECHAEPHTDYGGAAVKWGLTHHKESAADCCQACLDQAKNAKKGEMKCNIWVYCPSETGCFSPDIYEHKNQECWLKYAEEPKLNFKDKYSDSYRSSHPTAPLAVPWVSGVVRV